MFRPPPTYTSRLENEGVAGSMLGCSDLQAPHGPTWVATEARYSIGSRKCAGIRAVRRENLQGCRKKTQFIADMAECRTMIMAGKGPTSKSYSVFRLRFLGRYHSHLAFNHLFV